MVAGQPVPRHRSPRARHSHRQQLIEGCRRTGRASIDRWDFYVAYNFFRAAAISLGIGGRVRDGTAASEHALMMAALVRPLAEQAWAAVERSEAKSGA